MFRSEEEIKRDMLNRVVNTEDKTQNSFIHDALAPTAMEFTNVYMEYDHIHNKLDVRNLTGVDLDNYIYPRTGQERKRATKATTVVKIYGVPGTWINKGDLVGNFESLENISVGNSGYMEVSVQSLDYGTIGNIPAGAIDYFPVSIPGLFSVINEEPVTNGYDEEDDATYLDRYLERIRTPATSGNKYHYSVWAREVVGVGGARVFPLWDGNNTVKIVIIDSNKQPAGLDLIDEVQEYIDPGIRGLGEGQAPIGAFCTVVSADRVDIFLNASITRDSNYSLNQIKAEVEDKVIEYLKEIAFVKNLISYAHLGSILLSVEGVLDYRGLEINGGIDNVIVTDSEVAVLSEVILDE